MYEFLLFLSVVIFVATLAVYARHRAASVLHPVTAYLAFHGLVFTIRPIFARIYDYSVIYDAVDFTPSPWDKSVVLICTNLALVVFVTVALRIAPEPLAFRQTRAETLKRRALLKYFWLVAIPLGAAGTYSLYWMWDFEANSGMLGTTDLRSGFKALNAATGYFLLLGSMLAPLAAMCAYFFRFSLLSLLPFAAFAILKLGTGGRGDFIAGAAMLMVLYLYDKRRNWPNWRSVAAAVGALLVFTTVVQDRGAGVRELFGIEGVNETRVGAQDFTKPLEHMDFANLESFEFVVYAVPARTGSYDYFLHNLRILTEPIPRALWKDKPMGDPVRMFYLYDHGNFIAMALGVPAVGWYSLGYLGVVLWAALFAYMYASAYRRFNRGQQSNLALLAYAILLSTTIVAFRDGMLLTIVKQLFAYGLPLVLLWAIVRVFAPQLLRSPTQPEQKGVIGVAHRPRARRYTGNRTIPRAWRA